MDGAPSPLVQCTPVSISMRTLAGLVLARLSKAAYTFARFVSVAVSLISKVTFEGASNGFGTKKQPQGNAQGQRRAGGQWNHDGRSGQGPGATRRPSGDPDQRERLADDPRQQGVGLIRPALQVRDLG